MEVESLHQRWLIESLWARRAVGLLGGPPKSCKSWLGLDMALSVASDTPCLGRFPVREPGAALVYLAEDHLAAVRSRIESLCRHRGLTISKLDLYVVTASVLRLDLERDQRRLDLILSDLRPRLLVLDPLVRRIVWTKTVPATWPVCWAFYDTCSAAIRAPSCSSTMPAKSSDSWLDRI